MPGRWCWIAIAFTLTFTSCDELTSFRIPNPCAHRIEVAMFYDRKQADRVLREKRTDLNFVSIRPHGERFDQVLGPAPKDGVFGAIVRVKSQAPMTATAPSRMKGEEYVVSLPVEVCTMPVS